MFVLEKAIKLDFILLYAPYITIPEGIKKNAFVLPPSNILIWLETYFILLLSWKKKIQTIKGYHSYGMSATVQKHTTIKQKPIEHEINTIHKQHSQDHVIKMPLIIMSSNTRFSIFCRPSKDGETTIFSFTFLTFPIFFWEQLWIEVEEMQALSSKLSFSPWEGCTRVWFYSIELVFLDVWT